MGEGLRIPATVRRLNNRTHFSANSMRAQTMAGEFGGVRSRAQRASRA